MRKYYTDEQLAAIVHTAQCRLQYEQGDSVPSQPWESETEHIRRSCIEGVRRARAGITPEQHHEAWLKYKREAGWVYGAEKDPARKTHPCLISYQDLPEYQKDKNRLFLMIVAALTIEL
jgi:hypothetical protein